MASSANNYYEIKEIVKVGGSAITDDNLKDNARLFKATIATSFNIIKFSK